MTPTPEIGRDEAGHTGPPPSPPARARMERGFVRIDRAVAWLDGLAARWVPPEANPLAQAGAAANLALVIAIASGVALLGWYSPSLQFAYSSVVAMEGGTWGGWVRAVHRYSSDLAMLLVLVHAARVFFARKFTGARWLPWVSGIGLAALIWFIGWTGYWLLWDQPAQQVAVTSIRLLDELPIFGEPLGRLFIADRTVPSLLFFVVFFLHMLLPLAIAVGLAIHLMRLSRVKLFPRRGLSIAIGAGLALAALVLPAPVDARAEMGMKAASFTVDAWYLTPLALALRFQGSGLWVAIGGATVMAAAIPWILGRKPAAGLAAAVEASRCHACTQCVQDCPFDAIAMMARTDGKKFPSQAVVDPARCVGCGVCVGSCDSAGTSLGWFDTRREEARIAAEISAQQGATSWVAFVAGDIDGGARFFEATRWRERLPHYQVHFVPTASWIRPAFVEQILRGGVHGVLIIRDARVERPARDGNRWVSARLEGSRRPEFRADRAGEHARWRVIDYRPAWAQELAREAAAFRFHGAPGTAAPVRAGTAGQSLGALLLLLAIGAATIAPSQLRVSNPAPVAPELVFSFKAFGDWAATGALDAAADAAKPIHMRGRATEKPRRAPVQVRLAIDGAAEERTFRAKGISRDGPAIGEWRVPLAAGRREIAIELQTGPLSPPHRWSGTIEATPRRVQAVTFDPGSGFRLE